MEQASAKKHFVFIYVGSGEVEFKNTEDFCNNHIGSIKTPEMNDAMLWSYSAKTYRTGPERPGRLSRLENDRWDTIGK